MTETTAAVSSYSAAVGVVSPSIREFYLGQLRGLIDGLGIDKPFNLAGASFGGIVVAGFSAENPKDVASAALMAPAGLGEGGVVNPVLLLPVIGDWMFRAEGVLDGFSQFLQCGAQ